MEVLEFILKLAFGLGVLFVLGYLMSFVTGGISKAFGTTSTLNGRVVATPDTLDENIRELKELKQKFVNAYGLFMAKRSSTNYSVGEKVQLLKDLDDLRSKGAVSGEEYYKLKEQILK